MENNIYEWIYLSRQNDYEALNDLIQYFRPAITQIWADFFTHTLDAIFVEKEDFFMDADEILMNCISLYRHDKNRSFKAYYKQCVKNKGIDYCRIKYNQKKEGMYSLISLDAHIKENERYYYADLIKDDNDVNNYVLNKLYKEMVMEKVQHCFDKTSFEIIKFKLDGYRNSDICKILNLEKNKVYYTWKNFKKWIVDVDSLDV